MIHKQRYLTSLEQPPDMRPPLCLQYAIWATAASTSDKYSQFEDILYERARRYIDAAEMKVGHTFQLTHTC
jgi:phytoene/squalene synthetase